jgi:[acyl-carrier-protein] S-malonyltransferase
LTVEEKRRLVAKIAFLFPGQGSQYVGMGKDLYDTFPEARAIYDQADEWLGMDIRKLSFEGPEEELRKTFITQPAILVNSIAATEVLKTRGLKPELGAGHSLGEYSALYAAGALDLQSVLALVKRRGALMFAEGEKNPGTMAAIIGLPAEKVIELCKEVEGIVVPANFNDPTQTAISGQIPAVEKAMELAKARGALKAVRLPVSGAFHSPLLENSAREFGEFLKGFKIRDAAFPVIANVTGEVEQTAADIRANLEKQLINPVRWVKTIQTARGLGFDQFYEVGPGKVLSSLVRRIDRAAPCATLGRVEELNAIVVP